jgi:NAD(P)-dependent dehydrogenase (short-subunit alcohol dehydrogenase family)
MGALTGKHALVTGGGTGIGAAIARALAAEGAAVSVAGRRRAVLLEFAASVPMAAPICVDITKEDDCETMVKAARAAHGPIDIVIANAGMAESVPFRKMDLAHWERSIGVNLTGAFLTVRAALADVTRNAADDGRRVIFIASTAGLKGYPYVAAYCAAKHGVVGLARALGLELAASGVTVNAVCPGYTETPMLEASAAAIAAKTGRSANDALDALARDNPHGRLISPEEVAQTVLWLCTPAARAINGQAVTVPRDASP